MFDKKKPNLALYLSFIRGFSDLSIRNFLGEPALQPWINLYRALNKLKHTFFKDNFNL